jgi:hypothetical protein
VLRAAHKNDAERAKTIFSEIDDRLMCRTFSGHRQHIRNENPESSSLVYFKKEVASIGDMHPIISWLL